MTVLKLCIGIECIPLTVTPFCIFLRKKTKHLAGTHINYLPTQDNDIKTTTEPAIETYCVSKMEIAERCVKEIYVLLQGCV